MEEDGNPERRRDGRKNCSEQKSKRLKYGNVGRQATQKMERWRQQLRD